MAEYQVNTNESDLDKLMKQPRQYRTNFMIYRLTKADSYRLLKNTPPMTLMDYQNLRLALSLYVNEREKSTIETSRLTNYIKDHYTEEQYSEKLNYKVTLTLLSYFYNVPYSQIGKMKNLDKSGEDRNLYRVISYEELASINHMKEQLFEKVSTYKFPDDTSMLLYAQQLAEAERADFMQKYAIDPLLIEKGQYNCDEMLTAYQYTEKMLQQEKKKATGMKEKTEDEGRTA